MDWQNVWKIMKRSTSLCTWQPLTVARLTKLKTKLTFPFCGFRIAGHPLAQNEKCLHMFIQEPVIDKNYVPGKIRNTWASLTSYPVPMVHMGILCSHLMLLQSCFRSAVQEMEFRLYVPKVLLQFHWMTPLFVSTILLCHHHHASRNSFWDSSFM